MIPPSPFLLPDPWISDVELQVDVTVLLPNGLVLPLQVHRESTLEELKQCTWREAERLPLYRCLRGRDTYVFTCVSERTSEREEFADEGRKLCDVRPFQALLRLVERPSDKADRQTNAQIGLLIGKGLNSFDALKCPEVNEFRRTMRVFCTSIADKRAEWSPLDQVKYRYPARVDRFCSQYPPPHMGDRISSADSTFGAEILFENGGMMTMNVAIGATPQALLLLVMQSPASGEQFLCHTVEGLVLKVCGREEYLLEELPLLQYKYVQEKVSEGSTPQFTVVPISDIQTDHDMVYAQIERCMEPSFCRPSPHPDRLVSAWMIGDPFRVRVLSASSVNVESGAKLVVEGGLYHGTELLCQTQRTQDCSVADGRGSWDQQLCFDLAVRDLPQAVRLCLGLYEVTRGTRHPRARRRLGPDLYAAPLAWVNVTVYDFRGYLRFGCVDLSMWTYADEPHAEEMDLLHPMGTAVFNPEAHHATMLTIQFEPYHPSHPVRYPMLDEELDHTCALRERSSRHSPLLRQGHASKSHREQLRQIAEQDPLAPLHEQDRQLLWFLRYDCLELPHVLPKLLLSLRWGDHCDLRLGVNVTPKFFTWSTLETSELLKTKNTLPFPIKSKVIHLSWFFFTKIKRYTDKKHTHVTFALVFIYKLKRLTVLTLQVCILALSVEKRRKSLRLFKKMKFEICVTFSCVTRFGIVWFVFCCVRSEQEGLRNRQHRSFTNPRSSCSAHKMMSDSREKMVATMREHMSKEAFRATFRNLCSPLDPCHVFSQIKPELCRFMDSKMKPLWLVFENSDAVAEDIAIIFKHGDDLRQDMLTLQMIRIMDKLWKDEGYDFRMIPYQCLSTDHNVGLIEVVRNASTIANIQKLHNSSATSAFKKGSLFAWIKEHNKTQESLRRAVENFTLSCAGYCVATYVLGVADRHSDNIMIKANGELFHIDYGHILGKFKEKFGIKRERVPFVLTHDFVHVITHGHRRKATAFNRFQEYCERAFLILRRQGSLMISLFAMMLTTGMPELTSEKDLDYLRDALVLDYSEADALAHFRAKFEEALNNSWTTSINWFAHNISKDNK
ncbi:unnamed protein product [Ixodes pacificus]